MLGVDGISTPSTGAADRGTGAMLAAMAASRTAEYVALYRALETTVAAFVARSGLRLCEDLGADDHRRRYLGAAQPGYGFYRIALAEVPHAAAAG